MPRPRSVVANGESISGKRAKKLGHHDTVFDYGTAWNRRGISGGVFLAAKNSGRRREGALSIAMPEPLDLDKNVIQRRCGLEESTQKRWTMKANQLRHTRPG